MTSKSEIDESANDWWFREIEIIDMIGKNAEDKWKRMLHVKKMLQTGMELAHDNN